MFEIILMLGLSFPEVSGRGDFRHDLAGPQAGCIHVVDRVLGDAFLFLGRVENRGAVACADVIALPVAGRRIMDLEEELEQFPVADPVRIKQDFDGFGVAAVIAIGGVRNISPGITHARGDDTVLAANEILHAPEAPAGENGAFLSHRTSSTWSM